MNRHKPTSILIITSFIIVLIAFPSYAIKTDQQFRPSKKDYKRADKLLKKMSLDEKIGQLVHIGVNARFLNQDSRTFQKLRNQITQNKVGGIVVFAGGVYETVHLINRMQEASKIPLLISADFETGVGMRFREAINLPWNMAIAATGNPSLAQKMGAITAREATALGIQQVFAPVVDVNNNPNNPVINVRSFGEDPRDVARFGTAFMKGLQSGNVLATAKHFPGHGNTAVDSHRGLPVIDFTRTELEKTELVPFRELIKNGVGSVMISHISMPKLDNERVVPLKKPIKAGYTESQIITEQTTIPATLSKKIVTGILQNEMKFDGLIVTDAMDMSGLTLYFDQAESAIRAILAGNDILLKPASANAVILGIKAAVKSGRISEELLEQKVRKQIAWKHKLGLFKRKVTPISKIDSVVSNQETRTLAAEISQKAITLVTNENKALPIKKGQNALILCITNGKDIDFVGKTFANHLKANGVKAHRIALDERSTEKEIASAIKKAGEVEIVIAGLFGRVRSGAKNSIGIPKSGETALRQILKSDVKTVSIAFGNPYLILGFPKMKNYIVSYGDMLSLQKATADALLNKSDFYGKLPITIGKYPVGTGLNIRK